jgi:hypothetical protein
MADINLWLDDDLERRKPPSFGTCGIHWTWAKTAAEAIHLIQTENVVWASLDHDLADEHYFYFHSKLRECHEKGHQLVDDMCNHCLLLKGDPLWDTMQFTEQTGMSVIDYMEEHDKWPVHGVRIHTMNPGKKIAMLYLVNRQYGRTFQVQYFGTHLV